MHDMAHIQGGRSTKEPVNVLIVDDDQGICTSLQKILITAGLNASYAVGGTAALTALSERVFQLALVDLNMPGINGVEVIEQVRNRYPDTSIIVVSGENELDTAIKVLTSGAQDFIRKPFSPDELLFSVRNVLEKRSLALENREMLHKLKESEALHKFIVHNSPDLLYMLDRQGSIRFCNRRLLKTLGYSTKEVIGKHYSEFVHPEDRDRADFFFATARPPKDSNKVELRLCGKNDNTTLHVEIRTMQVAKNFAGGYRLSNSGRLKKNGTLLGTYGVARDITEKKRSEQIIRFQHNHDPLTGLPNRKLLNDRISLLLSQAKRNNQRLGVLLIDIERFKLINEAFGQDIGDRVLQSVAAILERNTRAEDTVARISNDEFAIVMPSAKSAEEAIAFAERIVRETAIPLRYQDNEVNLSLNIGAVVYPDNGLSREQLLRNADIAACHAKQAANSNICLYSPNLSNCNSNKAFTEYLIRNAIKNRQLVIHYQPQINLATDTIHAIEALVRIDSPEHGLIPPTAFIETAEESNLINELGDSILETILHDARDWHRQGVKPRLCINISAIQLAQETFADDLLRKIRGYGLEPERFEIEITENVLIQNMERSLENIIKLTNHNLTIAIDDFGTGYSSLSYLDQLPLHTLKLDKSFMQKISTANDDNTIIPAMLGVSNGLQLEFIAEGIETLAQHQYLKSLGRCIAQGFYYSRPIDRDQMLEYIRNYQRESSHGQIDSRTLRSGT